MSDVGQNITTNKLLNITKFINPDSLYYLNMSIEIASEFMEAKEKFNSLGYELIGTQDVNEQTIYLIKEKT